MADTEPTVPIAKTKPVVATPPYVPAPNAPLYEFKMALVVRRYEQIKLALMVIVLCLNLFIGFDLVGLARNNQASLTKAKETLVILDCAVAKTTSVGANGKPLTQAQARVAFDACIAKAEHQPVAP